MCLDQYNELGHFPAAVAIDSRNRSFLSSLPKNLIALEDLGIDYRIIFLESDENALVKRFSETRRKHPLTNTHTPLIDGIRQELELLAPLSERAVRRLNTSLMTPHELRRLFRDIAGIESFSGPVVMFESFGFKYGTPVDADFVFDVRCLPNPHWHDELRAMSGLDKPVQVFLENEIQVQTMFEHVQTFIEHWLPDFQQENRSYITVAIGCTGGKHRSVYMVEKLAQYFSKKDTHVQIWHREIPL